ncbi:MAG: hypothetical protein KF878_34040 [Planctomycetes bacterium]|nr:hypothetical protein [Planctomycetota bacterium]
MSAHLTRIVLPLLLGLLAGCNTGSPGAGQRKFSAGPPAGGPAGLRIAAVSDVAHGFGQSGETFVWVSDPALDAPRLFMDTGGGLVDTTLAPLPPFSPGAAAPGELLFQVTAPRGARLQVRGTRAGAPAESNVVTVGATPTAPGVTILSPRGRFEAPFVPPPVVPAPSEATWTAPQVDRFLVILFSVDVFNQPNVSGRFNRIERVVELPGTTTRFAWGDSGLVTYRAGPSIPGNLPAGAWALSVSGLDASGWGFSTSNDPSGLGGLFEFEVR